MNARNRDGIALLLSIVALLVLSAIVFGSFSIAAEEHRVGASLAWQTRAQAAAENGVQRVLDRWRELRFDTLARGVSAALEYPGDPIPRVVAHVRVTRVSPAVYLVAATGTADTLGAWAERRVGFLARIDVPDIRPMAALTVSGVAHLASGARLAGEDRTTPDPVCPPLDSPRAGLAMRDTALLARNGCENGDCVTGAPPVAVNPSAGGPITLGLDDSEWAVLRASASKTFGTTVLPSLGPTTVGGICDTTTATNWGDPGGGPCRHYLPVILATGNVTLSGGAGQGVLFVDGDLQIEGGLRFHGLVVVRGALVIGNGGADLVGAAAAGSVRVTDTLVAPGASVLYSRCAVATALLSRARIRGVTERAWTSTW